MPASSAPHPDDDAPAPIPFPAPEPEPSRVASELSSRQAVEDYAAALGKKERKRARPARLRPGFILGLLLFFGIAIFIAGRNPGVGAAQREAARVRAAATLEPISDRAYAEGLLDFAHTLALDHGGLGGAGGNLLRPAPFDETAYRELLFALMIYKAEADQRIGVAAQLAELRDAAGVRRVELPAP